MFCLLLQSRALQLRVTLMKWPFFTSPSFYTILTTVNQRSTFFVDKKKRAFIQVLVSFFESLGADDWQHNNPEYP